MTTESWAYWASLLVGLIAGLAIGRIQYTGLRRNLGMHLDATQNVLTVIQSVEPNARVPAQGVVDSLESIRKALL